jgi:hypothetical protein
MPVPDPPSPLPNQPSDGAGDTAEQIQWAKDTSTVLRNITGKLDGTNGHLGNIATQAEYQSGVLEQIAKNTGISADRAKLETEREQDVLENTWTIDQMVNAGKEKAAEGLSAWGEIPAMPSPELSSAKPNFSLSFFGATVDLDPFRNDRFGVLAGWLRSLFQWGIVVAFGLYAIERAREGLGTMLAAQQAKGNTFGGTGGQITALVAAFAMTAAVLTGIIALAAWKDTSLGGLSVSSAIGMNPLGSGTMGTAVWMIDQIFPITTALVAAVARIIWSMSVGAATLVVATIIRFIVP